MPYTVKALDSSTWDAFAALVERNNGVFGGCWWIGFHGELSRGDPALNRSRKQERDRPIGKHRWVVTKQVRPLARGASA
jgi:hypothetical protein